MKFLTTLVLAVLPSMAALADTWEDQINQCSSSDAVCVGKVLARQHSARSGGGGGGGGKVEYFHNDRCESSLLATVSSSVGDRVETCKALQATISDNVWGVRVNGNCSDISDTDFYSACMRFQ
jgi:hypothetical protein